MRNGLLWSALLAALVGCGSASGGGAGGAGGGAGAGGASATGAAGDPALGGAGGATGGGGSALDGGAAPALLDGTYTGSASGAACQGFPGLDTCPVTITVGGAGPTYQVTAFMLAGISGGGLSVTQSGTGVALDLLTDATADFCPSTEYIGSGTVGAGGSSLSVVLGGPPCEGSDPVSIAVTLTRS